MDINIPDYPCGYQPSSCDEALGAGTVFNAGFNAPNVDCDFPDGRRWLAQDDADVQSKFECAARVGLGGTGDEQASRAFRNAITEEMSGAGGCNEGFLRDDAILVVVMVTDEDEDDFHGDDLYVEVVAPQLYAEIIATKGNDVNGVVVVALLDDFELGDDYVCQEPAFPLNFNPAPNLRSFVDHFPRHFYGSVCDPDYAVPLSDAIDTIADACGDYIPPEG